MRRGLFGLATIAFAAFLLTNSLQSGEVVDKDERKVDLRAINADIRNVLDEPFLIPEEFKQPVSLSDVLKLFGDRIASKGKDWRIYVDLKSFQMVDDSIPDLLQAQVEFPLLLKTLPLGSALRLVMSQLPLEAEFLIRDGNVVIVHKSHARLDHLLKQKIFLPTQQLALRQALDQFSDRTGITIFIDPKCSLELNRNIIMHSHNDTTARGALTSWTEMFDLKAVIDENRVFITPREEYAKRLREDLEAEKLAAEIRKLQSSRKE